jgi:hypothetical protein
VSNLKCVASTSYLIKLLFDLSTFTAPLIARISNILASAFLTRYELQIRDFNCPEIDWDNLTAPHDGMQDKFLDLIESAGLNQLVEKPTRGDNILDLVFSDESLKVSNLTVSQQFSNSDHCQVSVSVFIDDSHASADCGTIACHKYYN